MNQQRTDDSAFRTAFSKALADALLEKENRASFSTSTSSPTDRAAASDEALMRAYRSLCFDNPIVEESDEVLATLANTITDPLFSSSDLDKSRNGKTHMAKSANTVSDTSRQLVLSDRFVSGVVQATSRDSSARISGTDVSRNGSTLDSTVQEGFSLRGDEMACATASGYAELALVIFARGSLGVAIAGPNDLDRVFFFLGSYTAGPTERSMEGIDKATRGEYGVGSVAGKVNAANGCLDEIFAEESDPDDFEFESDAIYACQFATATNSIDDIFNGHSAMCSPTTWAKARHNVKALLSHLTYANCISSISTTRWKKLDASKLLAVLSFTLLNEPSDRVGGEETLLHCPRKELASVTSSTSNEEITTPTDLRMEWPKIVFLLRDRALDPQHNHDALNDLLFSVLDRLLRVGEYPSTGSGVTPSQSVALLCLASLSSSRDIRAAPWARSVLFGFLEKSLDKLSHAVEVLRQSSYHGKTGYRNCGAGLGERQEVVWEQISCLVSVLEFLSGVALDVCGSLEGGGVTKETQSAMLSTGFFREIVLLCVDASNPNRDGNNGGVPITAITVRRRFLFSLFAFCVSSESLCSYVVRVPKLATHLTSDDEFVGPCLADATLWALLCVHVHGFVTKKKVTGDLEVSLQKIATEGFPRICERASSSLLFRTESGDSDAETTQGGFSGRMQDSLRNFLRFANCLESAPDLASAWCTWLLTNSTALIHAKRGLSDLKDALLFVTGPDGVANVLNEQNPQDEEQTERSHVEVEKEQELALGVVKSDTLKSVRRGVKNMASLILEAQDFTATSNVRNSSCISSTSAAVMCSKSD